MSSLNSKTISIYLDRACNLSCSWCYDQANSCEAVDISRLQRFHDAIIKDHVENIILIGGEPLIYPHIIDVLELFNNKNVILVTNGIQLANSDYFNQILRFKNISFSLSLKGYNRESFKFTTNKDCFEDLSKVLTQLPLSNILVNYSYVFDSIRAYEDKEQFLDFCKTHLINQITIGEVRPFVDCSGRTVSLSSDKKPFEEFITYLIENGLDVIAKIQSPLCEYSSSFINLLLRKKRLVTTCSVKSGGALVFNSNLDLILCDACYDICLATFEEDFYDYKTFSATFFSKDIRKVYNKLSGCPSIKCTVCDKWKICGGGCILNWRKNEN